MTIVSSGPQPATTHTCAANQRCCAGLRFEETRDFDDARRGFVATLPDVTIASDGGGPAVVWSLRDYAFLAEEAVPDTVNASLWRQARLNMHHGLFQVTDRIWQVRGYDISNMTLIEGARGVIIIDPLISVECARAALALYRAHRGDKPVTAVIYTHSHVDHYGGVAGVVRREDVAAGLVAVIAPDKFLEEVTKENVLAGAPMLRRAAFQFGPMLPKGPRGQVDAGLGKVTSRGTVSLIAPTQVIRDPVERHVVDGVEIMFQLTPDAEAPAEMHMFYPGLRALNLAENATHNLHNIYPIRGAQVRDANAWSKYLGEALVRYAPHVDVAFAQHHWPTWGTSDVATFLERQRDAYKFMHDQTLRLLNHGLKPAEIAERLQWPPSLATNWATRGYYGTLSHNAKAIYQRYVGWYDGNPVNLNPLPPVPRARKQVAYMGGADALMQKARADYAAGEYRWVADVTNVLVFADPGHVEARALCADACEQLGYQSESATWRNAYLQAALELRRGAPKLTRPPVRPDVVAALTVGQIFDWLGTRLDPAKADGHRIVLNLDLPDLAERYALTLQHATLTHVAEHHAEPADALITIAKPTLADVLLGRTTLAQAILKGEAMVLGDGGQLDRLLAMLETIDPSFPIMEPHPSEL